MIFNKLIDELSENSGYSKEACLYLIKQYTHLFISLILIMIVAYILNVKTYVGIIISTIMILRAFSGGGHSKSKIICTIISSVYPIGSALIINRLVISNTVVLIVSLIVFIVGICIIYKYAPADTLQKPIVSLKFKKQLKRNSLMFITIAEIIILYTTYINYLQISLSIIMGLSWQLFTVLPIGYKFFNLIGSKQEVIK